MIKAQEAETPHFSRITVCLDRLGCPNRCRHCWLGVTPNGRLTADDLEFVALAFRPYATELEVIDRYREEDFGDDYQAMWRLTSALSDGRTPHFELMSYWRAVRDPDYLPWLAALGVRTVQLTLFGGEETTDYFVGRKGAYREILASIELLLPLGIVPRIQLFIYKSNLHELPAIEVLLDDLRLEERAAEQGQAFSFFLHQGSCDGESEQLYDDWITEEDLPRIPRRLVDYTLRHFGKSQLQEVLGETERALCRELANDHSTATFVTERPVFHVDRHFDVYPNVSAPSPCWWLGNLKRDGAAQILRNYGKDGSLAQQIRRTVPLSRLVAEQGREDSLRLFQREDYKMLLLNRFCRGQRAGETK